MSMKGRIERLEIRRSRHDDTVTLGDIVAASYMADGDPRLAELEERFSRSWLVALIVKTFNHNASEPSGALGRPGQASLH